MYLPLVRNTHIAGLAVAVVAVAVTKSKCRKREMMMNRTRLRNRTKPRATMEASSSLCGVTPFETVPRSNASSRYVKAEATS